MITLLTATEINELLELLNPEQKDFLNQYIKQNKKSKWLETLARKKGIVINNKMDIEEIEKEIGDWLLVEILDGGEGNRPYKCECGNSLRKQYIVYHQSEDRTYGLGSSCFKNYTNLSPGILKDIKGGFYSIDLERDEILMKVKERDFTDLKDFEQIEGIPKHILNQIEIGLPLTDNQLIKSNHIKNVVMKKRLNEDTYKKLNPKQKEQFDVLHEDDKEEILKKIQKGDFFEGYNIHELPDYIIKHINSGLPLLKNHISLIRDIERHKQIYTAPSKISYRREKEPTSYTSVERKAISIPQPIPYVPPKRKPIPEKIDFDTLMLMHLSTLKGVRKKEKTIGIKSEALKKDWVTIQQMVRDVKNGETINYPLLKLLLSNLIIPLRVERDEYL